MHLIMGLGNVTFVFIERYQKTKLVAFLSKGACQNWSFLFVFNHILAFILVIIYNIFVCKS